MVCGEMGFNESYGACRILLIVRECMTETGDVRFGRGDPSTDEGEQGSGEFHIVKQRSGLSRLRTPKTVHKGVL